MSSAFLERFKNKQSVISKNGDFDFTNAQPVNRINSAVPQKRSQESPKVAPQRLASAERTKSQVDFQPYTLQEYSALREQPLVLGGLGPTQVGSEEWAKRKALQDRKQDYARLIQAKNRQLPRALPPRSAQPARPSAQPARSSAQPARPSARDRALQFAKKLPKPPKSPQQVETQKRTTPPPMTDLEELEAKHAAYQRAVAELKSQLR